MAHKYICDRCHSESADSNHIKRCEFPRPTTFSDFDEYWKELCIHCLRQLEEWLKPLAMEEKRK